MNELLDLALHHEIQYTVTEEEVTLDIIKKGKTYHYEKRLADSYNVDDIEIATLECIKEFYNEL